MTWLYKGPWDGDLTILITHVDNERYLFIYGDGAHEVRYFNTDHLIVDKMWELVT